MKFSRAANGDFVKGEVIQNARTSNFLQTDLSIRHEIPVMESRKLSFEANIANLFNRRGEVAINQIALGSTSQLISPSRAKRFADDPGVDWGKILNGYNYLDALNGTGTFAGSPALTLASRYGMPQVFQSARVVRLAVRFTF